MSVINPGDEAMHYSDGSHRWIPPTLDRDVEGWRARVLKHVNLRPVNEAASR